MRKWMKDWNRLNPTLADGEIGEIIGMLETKTGDGRTPWKDLSFTAPEVTNSIPSGFAGSIGPVRVTYTEMNAATDYASGVVLSEAAVGDWIIGFVGIPIAPFTSDGTPQFAVHDELGDCGTDNLWVAPANNVIMSVPPHGGVSSGGTPVKLWNLGDPLTGGEYNFYVHMSRI